MIKPLRRPRDTRAHTVHTKTALGGTIIQYMYSSVPRLQTTCGLRGLGRSMRSESRPEVGLASATSMATRPQASRPFGIRVLAVLVYPARVARVDQRHSHLRLIGGHISDCRRHRWSSVSWSSGVSYHPGDQSRKKPSRHLHSRVPSGLHSVGV